eukprot:CAMPEP_0172408358 /NCGR_PEP_ID=MMETSP1061-20121228/75812_1 /TAXON_ID=37318 /ORGANISM="Pseudo-nitzschia pungens, Strain cf. pungens" /LENGTH=378 /DNA_ID=CAMNT_0013144483 /DNA_START=437 /DNA_END=1573 /DNA_ORIENTATION=-
MATKTATAPSAGSKNDGRGSTGAVAQQSRAVERMARSPPPHPSADACGAVLPPQVLRHWEDIDAVLERDYLKAEVSGGIFLYRNQASVLTEMVRKILHVHANARNTNTNTAGVTTTICETGFGSGHSMALFREAAASATTTAASPLLRIVSFDKFDRPYQLPIWHRFNETTTNGNNENSENDSNHHQNSVSLDLVVGDSCKTVPDRLRSLGCNVLHGSSLCPTDNIDLVEHSPCGVLLTSTAMQSVAGDKQVYFGERRSTVGMHKSKPMGKRKSAAQWRNLRERNCITNIACFRESGPLDLQRDFVFAKKDSADKVTGEFCVAITTGICQRRRNDNDDSNNRASTTAMTETCANKVRELAALLDLDAVCPRYRIDPPA